MRCKGLHSLQQTCKFFPLSVLAVFFIIIIIIIIIWEMMEYWYSQRAKKVVSNSPGLVDFATALVFFVLNLPDRQVLFLGEIQITEGLLSILLIKKGFGAS